MCKVVGGARAVYGQAECFEDHILADVFTEGSCSLVLYNDHVNSITRNTQLLYICYFRPIGYLVPSF